MMWLFEHKETLGFCDEETESVAANRCIGAFFVLKPANANSTRVVKKEGSDLQSPYVGHENRDIKSLSDKDIEALELGSGTAFNGLAKPAELSGYPGPSTGKPPTQGALKRF